MQVGVRWGTGRHHWGAAGVQVALELRCAMCGVRECGDSSEMRSGQRESAGPADERMAANAREVICATCESFVPIGSEHVSRIVADAWCSWDVRMCDAGQCTG